MENMTWKVPRKFQASLERISFNFSTQIPLQHKPPGQDQGIHYMHIPPSHAPTTKMMPQITLAPLWIGPLSHRLGKARHH